MKVEIVMPKMGESINEGTILKWYKKEGDTVKKDEILYDISTDKIDTEIPSPENGILSEIKVFEQETVAVGTVVAIIETNGILTSTQTKVEDAPSTTQVGGEIIDIIMPKMGESITEGTIIKWLKKANDKVKRDEIIFEISTDKVDTEVPSSVDGTITEILYKENDTVDVGTVIARVSTSGGVVKKEREPKQEEILMKKENHIPVEMKQASSNKEGNPFYSPLVLNIARTENISFDELTDISGTGTGGRITKNDLLKYIQNKKSGIETDKILFETAQTNKSKTKTLQRIETIPMDNNRQRIMHHMINSKDTSVHVTAVSEVDMSIIHAFLKKSGDSSLQSDGIKLTYLAFIAFAVIKALKEFPLMNASLEGNNILVKHYINLGIAVALKPNGLIVPNIKSADEKNIKGLAKAILDLSNRARNKKLVPDDIADGTFTITNYGIFGSLFGTPIINQPEVGILGVGAVTKKPVVVENAGLESIAIKPMMYLSLSHDHRLVDGMLGGRFLKSVKDILENFDTGI
jgi:2-oxoglutarate dehydrogenase E2 component (dihydrolipoamide succinyltransferase)